VFNRSVIALYQQRKRKPAAVLLVEISEALAGYKGAVKFADKKNEAWPF
jgi:hypothetical protein